MANVHSPERQPGESQEQYRERRTLSRGIAKSIRCVGIGDQHKAPTARQQLRDKQRANGTLRGTYGQGLMNAWDRKREREQAKKHPLRDDNGAFTMTGATVQFVDCQPGSRYTELGGQSGPEAFFKFARRVWLAGISAQRGY